MSGANDLERSVLERKERNELHVIAESLGLDPGTRTKKADLIDKILEATGMPEPNGWAPEPGWPQRVLPTPQAATARGDAGSPHAGERTEGHPNLHPSGGSQPVAAPEPAGIGGALPDPPIFSGAARPPGAAPSGAAVGDPGARPPGAVVDDPVTAGEETSPVLGVQGDNGPAAGSDHDHTRAAPGHRSDSQRGREPPSLRGNTVGEGEGGGRRRRRRGRDRQPADRDSVQAERPAGGDAVFSGEAVACQGFLDLRDEGFGYVRASGFTAGPTDVYVASIQAKRFGLRKGDFIEGMSRPAGSGEKFPALVRIDKVGGMSVEQARERRRFEDLTPLFPDHRLNMETPNDPTNVTARIVDLMCPIGKGQRGLIVSPPKAGKTTVIKQIAKSVEANNPEVHLIVLLVDERPEEVTDMRRTVKGEVIASTFDRPSDEHTQVAELALERAKRLVEMGRDVVIILDGITRLTRAYNLSAPASGRLTSGGIDQAAIYPPKKFFGAARNAEEGGSLTILATALVETGSKADDVIFEELKGTGNMELRLDRRLAERRLYPAIDVNASSTRHEELLFDRGQLQLVWRLRRVLNGLSDDGTPWKALELLMDKIRTTRTNSEFLSEVARTQMTV